MKKFRENELEYVAEPCMPSGIRCKYFVKVNRLLNPDFGYQMQKFRENNAFIKEIIRVDLTKNGKRHPRSCTYQILRCHKCN